MNRIFLIASLLLVSVSCSKIEETVTSTVTTAQEKAQQKASEMVQETVNEQLNKLINSETVTFSSVFPNESAMLLENETGRKMNLPNGQTVYIFRYKTGDKDALLNVLVDQPTTDESKSKKEFQKIDGAGIVEKLTFFEKFLPANTIDTSFLNDIKNDKNIEYYKVNRFPNTSTIIFNPKNETVYQFVEVKKQ